MLYAVQTAAEHAASSNAPTIQIAMATLVLGAGQALQAWAAHRKGKQGATHASKKLDSIVEKLDEFIDEQRTTNHGFDKRISEVFAHVIGPDGENGLRSRVKALEERGEPVRLQDVGSYRKPA